MREQIIAEARSWIGTPYQHQASVKGAGCDCLGLIRGVWRAVIGPEPMPIPPYSRHWDDAENEPLLEVCQKLFTKTDTPQPGDILLFRMLPNGPCKHLGVLSSENTFIHAYEGRAVTENHLVPYWTRRIASAFIVPSKD